VHPLKSKFVTIYALLCLIITAVPFDVHARACFKVTDVSPSACCLTPSYLLPTLNVLCCHVLPGDLVAVW